MSMWYVAEEASKSEQGKQGDSFDKVCTDFHLLYLKLADL